MQNKNLIQFAQSLILLPAITLSAPIGSLPKNYVDANAGNPQSVLLQKQNIVALNLFAPNQAEDKEAKILKLQADAIDAYFSSHDMPLAGKGMKFAQVAKDNDLDYRLLVGISAAETTGGRSMCRSKKAPNNPFGWGSCKIGFDSIDEAIETVGEHLGGNVASTARHYADKTTKEILQKYNPPSVVPRYAQIVMSIMKDVGPEEITLPDDTNNPNT
ncbi:MAG: hypothetical protein WCI41_01880 [bacterium]